MSNYDPNRPTEPTDPGRPGQQAEQPSQQGQPQGGYFPPPQDQGQYPPPQQGGPYTPPAGGGYQQPPQGQYPPQQPYGQPQQSYGQPQQPYGQQPQQPPPGYQQPGAPYPYPQQTNITIKKRNPIWIILGVLLIGVCACGGIGLFLVQRAAQTAGTTLNTALNDVAATLTVMGGGFESTLIAEETQFALTPITFDTPVPEATTSSSNQGLADAAPTDTPEPAASSGDTATATEGTASGGTAAGGPAQSMGSSAVVDGVKVTVNSAKRMSTGLLPPKSGMEYLIIDLTFENTTADNKAVSSLLSFSVANSTGKTYDLAFGADAKRLEEGNLPANSKLSGETAFEVPTGSTGLIFTYKTFMGEGAASFKLDK